MSLWEKLLNLLFPPKCAFCGALLQDGEKGVCAACEKALPYVEEGQILRALSFGPCAVTFYYEDMVRQGIHGLKFHGRRASAAVFARYMAQTAAEHLAGTFDAVTFVPVSARRLKQRGYDQSRLLAEGMAALWDTKAEAVLEKVRDNPAQSGLSDAGARRDNVRGVYRIREGAQVAGKRFLLVDDVLTTGSTLSECAATLLAAGAASVVSCALATPGARENSGTLDEKTINKAKTAGKWSKNRM